MAPGGIYTKCEEPDTVELKDNMSDKNSRRAGGFLLQCCRCFSEGTSISVLYIANVVLFLLWIITISVISAKYSKMAKEVEQLHENQTQLRANDTYMEKKLEKFLSTFSSYATKMNNSLKSLEDNQTKQRDDDLHHLQTENLKIWKEMYKVENALHSLNASGCKMCPEGWLLNRGQCYYFREKSITWSSARTFCQGQGGDLVVINDEDEQTFLRTKKNSFAYWIGLHDMKNENNFVWVDNSRLSYTHWSAGEPNDYGHGEDCVQMGSNGWWNDYGCGNTVEGSICEKTWNCQ